MARLRVRLRFNPGKTGAPLDRLGDFASSSERFLRALSRDLGLTARKGEWLATEFENSSVAFDCSYASSVADEIAIRGTDALAMLTSDDPLSACDRGLMTFETAADFAQIGRVLDPDDYFQVGLYRNGADPDWKRVTYQDMSELRRLLTTPIESYGSVQGFIHAWYSGAEPAFFQVRELSSGDLIHATYKSDLHAKILQAHESERHTVVHVYGNIRWDRTKTRILEISVVDIDLTQPLSEAEFNRLFGSMPAFTGEMTTTDYLDWIREDGE